MEILEEVKRSVATRHERLRDLKKKGVKIVGYTCTYVPVEIVSAAGAVPIRVLSIPEGIKEAGRYVQSFFCHHMRSFFDQGLRGIYDYLDGFVVARTCDAMSAGYEHWKKYVPTPYTWFLQSPTVQNTSYALDYWITELERFKQSLSEFMGRGISDDDLRSAIDMYNTNRQLFRQLYDLRKREQPTISGTETLKVMLLGLTMPVEEHNRLLKELLRQLPGRVDLPEVGLRLMVIGGPLDESELPILEEIESLGGMIVTDDTCTGTEVFSEDVIAMNSPLPAIASRYLRKVPCAEKVPWEPRFEHVLKLASDYEVQGAVFILEKYCDPHLFAYPDLRKALQGRMVPSLLIETGEAMPLAQVRTRVEAFFEMIRED